jgi:hypothetical protein
MTKPLALVTDDGVRCRVSVILCSEFPSHHLASFHRGRRRNFYVRHALHPLLDVGLCQRHEALASEAAF